MRINCDEGNCGVQHYGFEGLLSTKYKATGFSAAGIEVATAM
jgi:hypothetical protein